MNSQSLIKRSIPYVSALLIFIVIALIYCSPAIEGKIIQQTDVLKARGMQKEIKDYHDRTGEYTLWTNSMFGGMPTYQIGAVGAPNYNVYHIAGKVVRLKLPKYSADLIFLYFISFFILLIALKVNPWLSIVGALAFGFSSYNFIIIGAGHVNKALAIAVIPAIIGGILLIYRKKYIIGAILTLFSFGIHIAYNHFQMTYYMLLLLLVFLITQFISDFREKKIKEFIVASLIAGFSLLIALIPNSANLLTTYEYSKETIRGKTELSTSISKNEHKGLEKEYALQWSYGVAETFTFLIPNFYGGASASALSENSETYKTLTSNGVPKNQARQIIKNAPTYWGDQPGTSGPVYFGAIVCFLFVLGLFLIDKKTRWWVLIGTVLTIALSWGRNFEPLTDLFFYHFPMYNKFRAVSSILIIPSITFPFVAFLGLKSIVDGAVDRKQLLAKLKISLGITGGFALFFTLFGGALFSFNSPTDPQLATGGYPQWLIDAFIEDREKLFKADAFRSFVFILIGAALVWAYSLKKLKLNIFILLLGIFIVADLWPVDKRYLNNEDFQPKRTANQFAPTNADLQILQDKDPNFRVFNLTMNPFTETYTSYFHKSVGGYHGAKLRRYQEVIERHLSKQNMAVINMLNTKYFIVPDQQGSPVAQRNSGSLGNAWFVDDIKIVENADQEIHALGTFDPAQTAIVDERYLSVYPDLADYKLDSASTNNIVLDKYEPNQLTYSVSGNTAAFAVFSEIYYNSGLGWNAYLDGEKVEHIRVNYILRGMKIPAGEHSLEFRFEPKTHALALKIELLSSILVVLIIGALILLLVKQKSKPAVPGIVNQKE